MDCVSQSDRQTVKLTEGNKGEYIYDFGVGRQFFKRTQKTPAIKRILKFIELNSFSENKVRRMEGKPPWRKIFGTHIFNKELRFLV